MRLSLLFLISFFSIFSLAQSRKSLKEAAAKHQVKIGASVSAKGFFRDEAYKNILKNELNILTPENAFKFADISPKRNFYDFKISDKMVEFARDNSMVVRGHCFDWHLSVPAWLKTGTYTSSDLESILKSFIEKTMTHYKEKYPGVVQYWDVVNEAFDDDAVLRTTNIWSRIGTTATDHIEFAFKTAYQTDPSVKLFYNDYGIEELNPKSDAVYELIKSLKEKNIPIHGIGFQMHLVGIKPYNFESMAKNFERFRKLGLIIHITELNHRLDLNGKSSATPDQLEVQAQNFSKVAKLCINEPSCEAIIHWNLTDKYYDVEPRYVGWGSVSILNATLNEKPSFLEFLKVFETTEPKK